MILKLRNGKIILEYNKIPFDVHNIKIDYDYELGTNHYKPLLIIDGKHKYYGNNLSFKYDSQNDTIKLEVNLLDTRNRVVKSYVGEFTYFKTCYISNKEIVDLYKKVEELYNENIKLKEQGEVI